MSPDEVAVVDFFSGCGGTSSGFEDAGMRISAGIDSDRDSAATFRRNFPNAKFLEEDIRTLDSERLLEFIPDSSVTLFSGCAPCQPFSRQNGHRDSKDPRRSLLSEFQRIVIDLKPHLIVVENVPGLQAKSKEGPLFGFLDALSDHGYESKVKVVRALELGVPQERRRLVVLASRIGSPQFPMSTHAVAGHPPATVRDAIGDLPPITAGGVDPLDGDHAAMRLSDVNRARIRATPEGGDRRNWVDSMIADCHKLHGGHSDAYGRMWWDRPASGLTTRCLSYSNGRFGHPEQDRAISLREAASLQTFPRSFRFEGSLTSKGRQVGNAVPPLMARRIAESLVESL